MFVYKDVKTTPLNKKHIAHKEWTITDETAPNFGIVSYSGQASNGEFYVSDPSSSNVALEPLTSNNYYQRTLFNSIHNLYYTDIESFTFSGDNEYLGQQIRTLNQKFVTLSIPSGIFGERIKEGSFSMSHASYATLRDDGQGNIIDQNITNIEVGVNTFHRFEKSDYIIKIDFNDGWKFFNGNPATDTTFRTGNLNLSHISDGPFEPMGENITFGIHNTDLLSGLYGTKDSTFLNLSGTHTINSGSNSFIRIDRTDFLNNERRWNDQFAIAFWLNAPPSQSVTSSFNGPFPLTTPAIGQYQYRGVSDTETNVIVTSRGNSDVIPWEIDIYNRSSDKKGKLRFRRGKKDNYAEITSSAALNDGNWHFIYAEVNNSGKMRLWVDSTYQATAIDDPMANELVPGTGDIHIGARQAGFKSRQFFGLVNATKANGTNALRRVYDNKAKNYLAPFSGSIDKFKIFNAKLSSVEIYSLNNFYRDTDIVGNVFYNHGMAVITDPSGSYTSLINDYTLKFKATTEHTIHNYQCIIEDEQYNFTFNPSARKNQDKNNSRLQAFATASDFAPYITTIGLYNEFNELLAIGKLANPVKSPQELDLVINVQFDT